MKFWPQNDSRILAAALRWLILVLSLGYLVGCSLPQWRVFQQKVDRKMTETPAQTIEAQRSGAKFLEVKSATAELDPVLQLAELHAIASPLSSSLGQPNVSVSAADGPRVLEQLRAGVLSEQAKNEQLRAFIRKYDQTPLQGTGINLAGPAGVVALLGIIAACIACPALGYLALRVVPVLWGYFRRTTAAVSEFAAANPDAGQELKLTLSRRMDEKQKKLVRRFVRPPAVAGPAAAAFPR